MRYDDREKVLEEVFVALARCPVHRLPNGQLGMAREDASAALASLNGGVIPRPKEVDHAADPQADVRRHSA